MNETFRPTLTDKERGFLITCIMTAASEYSTGAPRYNEKYNPSSGVKYEGLSKIEVIDLTRKLLADNDDLEELLGYLGGGGI